jgi:ABC-type proline/glycine betaine transport system ATPase subunit
MSTAILVSSLVKSFGQTRALDGLDLSIRTGEVDGFLDPNGAGKTTTIRILLGLIRADAGDAQLLGGDPWEDAPSLHRRLAYVLGGINFFLCRRRDNSFWHCVPFVSHLEYSSKKAAYRCQRYFHYAVSILNFSF